MAAPSDTETEDAWTRYWQNGPLHSLPGSYPGNYDGSIRAFWARHLDRLGQAGRMLDVATGNGALPALALELLGVGHAPEIDAIDSARIHPSWVSQYTEDARARLHFHERVRAEQLPFHNERFDLITSQFGFEYTDSQRTLPELARVLRPGGTLALVMHHRHSRLSTVASEEAAHLEWLLGNNGLPALALPMYPYVAKAADPQGRAALREDHGAETARARFNQGMQAFQQRLDGADVPDTLIDAYNFIANAFGKLSSGEPPAHALQAHEHHLESLQAARQRCLNLYAHALSESDMVALRSQMAMLGLTSTDPGLLHHENGALLAWTLTATAS